MCYTITHVILSIQPSIHPSIFPQQAQEEQENGACAYTYTIHTNHGGFFLLFFLPSHFYKAQGGGLFLLLHARALFY